MADTLPIPPMPPGGEAFGAWWDEEAARRAAEFFPTYLRHTEAEWAGRPFRLADWQRDKIIRPIYGWKRADGSRLIRIVWIEVPRKNGKTEMAAGMSILGLLADGEMGAQAFSLAVDRTQARIVFQKACTMVQMSDALRKHAEVYATSIYCPELTASFRPLSAGPKGKHGLSASFAIGDEVHEWPDGELADVVHKSTAARRQPLEIYITTAGVTGHGYPWEMHQLATQVLAGEIEDPTFLPVIFGADPDDDWQAEATWRKANPNYGVSVKPEYIAEEARKAGRLPRLENDFRRFHLNQWTEQTTRWLPMGDPGWKGCTEQPDNATHWRDLEERLAGRRCYGGIDLAITRDMTSRCLCFPPEGDETRHTFLWRFWLPQATVDDQPLARRRLYESYQKAGLLALTPGNVTDYAFLEQELLRDADRYRIEWLGIDRYNASDLMIRLKDQHGLPVQPMGQGFVSMNSPSKGFERLVLGNLLEHGNNPVAKWMAGNAVVERDSVENIKPSKQRASDKIDGIVAAIIAFAGASMGGAEEAPYQDGREMLVLG